MNTLRNLEFIESAFFKVLADLKDFLSELTLVGGWMPYVYSHFLWNNPSAKIITTTDIDFGFGSDKPKAHLKTIFELLSSLDYKERHIDMDRMYPVVLYKEGKVRLDFIASEDIKNEIIEKLIGKQISINKVEKFDFLLNHRTLVEITDKINKNIYKIPCPAPSAFLYHKGAIFIDRDDAQKQAKDLHYMYFILRYCPDINEIYKEIKEYKKQGIFKEVSQNLEKYFERKTSQGCLMVEKENGPDEYISDIRQDIFDRFTKLIGLLQN